MPCPARGGSVSSWVQSRSIRGAALPTAGAPRTEWRKYISCFVQRRDGCPGSRILRPPQWERPGEGCSLSAAQCNVVPVVDSPHPAFLLLRPRGSPLIAPTIGALVPRCTNVGSLRRGLSGRGARRASVRWVAGAWVVCCLVALAIVFPGFLIAGDHHGAERIRSHEHVARAGSMGPGHSHGFERPHTHENGSRLADGIVPALVRGNPLAPLPASSPPSAIALPLVVAILALPIFRSTLVTRRSALANQATFAPPTRPPSSLAALP